MNSNQIDLLGKRRQIWSCCHCSWEGYVDGTISECPNCGWAIWKKEKAKEMTDMYSAFKKKYGEKK